MSVREIWGNTVGMGLPKPDLMQSDPKKGDYVKNKENFLKQVNTGGSDLGGSAITEAQINALDGMFRICTFSEDPTEAYAIFRAAFGLSGSEGGGNPPDIPTEPEQPADGVVQTGNVLVITNGVTVSKTDSTLTIT